MVTNIKLQAEKKNPKLRNIKASLDFGLKITMATTPIEFTDAQKMKEQMKLQQEQEEETSNDIKPQVVIKVINNYPTIGPIGYFRNEMKLLFL